MCVYNAIPVDSSNSNAPLSTPSLRTAHTHYQHVIRVCVVCSADQQLWWAVVCVIVCLLPHFCTITDKRPVLIDLCPPLATHYFQYTCEQLHDIPLLSPYYVLTFTYGGENPSTSLYLPHWYSTVCCQLKIYQLTFMPPIPKKLDKFGSGRVQWWNFVTSDGTLQNSWDTNSFFSHKGLCCNEQHSVLRYG